VFRGILRCGRESFPAFAREGLAAADFTDPDHATLYAWCRERWERDWPTALVDVYRGVREDRTPRFRGPLFGRGFALWLADAFTSEWWPAEPAAAEFFESGRVGDVPIDLWVATVAARTVRVLAERRRELVRADVAMRSALDAALTPGTGAGSFRIFNPNDHTEEDDDVETRGPR
jgi:hypothetical protein